MSNFRSLYKLLNFIKKAKMPHNSEVNLASLCVSQSLPLFVSLFFSLLDTHMQAHTSMHTAHMRLNQSRQMELTTLEVEGKANKAKK